MQLLTDIHIRNYRSLADVQLDLPSVNVFFGPNGSGKSALLDALWFLHECATQGVDSAAATRDRGIGLLSDSAAEGANISLAVSTGDANYEVTIGFLSGRIDSMPGEHLYSELHKLPLIQRGTGSNNVVFQSARNGSTVSFQSREPDRLSLQWYPDYKTPSPELNEMDRILRCRPRTRVSAKGREPSGALGFENEGV